MFKKITHNIPLINFVLILSAFNFIFFHYPFYVFVFQNLEYNSFGGGLTIFSLMILMLVANAFAFYLILFLLRKIGKIILGLSFILNAISVYFIITYNVIIDGNMIGNVLNTNYEEASSFFSFKMIIYLFFLGILPCIYIFKAKIDYPVIKQFLSVSGGSIIFMLVMVFANGSNWLWIDKNSKQLGGLAMPWSYSVNTAIYHIQQFNRNKKEIILPDAQIMDNQKSIVVLVIGESARSQNFSLYGYNKNTNPLLSQVENLYHYPSQSCATYTTAGVKCILEHENTGDLYEILPNYLYRNGADVIWRTTNSGEPPIHIEKYQNREYLQQYCQENCEYDEVLLAGLKEEITASDKDKIFVILHTGTSHGPTYNLKYPSHFEHFSPVCTSVELANCTSEELINAYDNTIVYTDYILAKLIDNLKELDGYQKTMLYVSDHGESLGERNLYMHGLPMNLAPREQYEIPFIIWTDGARNLKNLDNLSQHNVFHSILNLLSIQSPIYKEEMNIFE